MLFCYFNGLKAYQISDTRQNWKEIDLTFEEFRQKLGQKSDPYYLGIWIDGPSNEVNVYRDFFGLMPFYYYQSEKGLIFSNYLPALAAELKLKNSLTLNESEIARYLSSGNYSSPYRSSTFYNEIHSVLPGYITKFTPEGFTFERFDILRKVTPSEPLTEEEYGDGFKELLVRSIKHGVNGHRNIASHLTGGLDSSSIVCCLNQMNEIDQLLAIRLFEEYPRDEKLVSRHDITYAREVARACGIELLETKITLPNAERIKKLVQAVGQPPMLLGIDRMETVLNEIKERNSEVLMTGNLGDAIVGFGMPYLDELWEQKNWQELNKCLELLAQNGKLSDPDVPFSDVIEKVKLQFLQKKISRLGKSRKTYKAQLLLTGMFRLKMDPLTVLNDIKNRVLKRMHKTGQLITPISILPASFEKSEAKLDEIQILHNIRVMEEHYALSIYSGIKIRDPYCNYALYEYCESIPQRVKFYEGYGRGPQRLGLRGILTEKVRTRKHKSNPGSTALSQWTRNLFENSGDLLNDESPVWQYVDRAAFMKNYENCISGKLNVIEASRILSETYKVVLLAAWLMSFPSQ